MAGAFQTNAFQNNAFQVGGAASTAGQTELMRGKSGPGSRPFTRKRYDEFMAAWRAQEALEVRASEEKGKRKKALEKAASIAAEAIRAAQQAESDTAQAEIVRLTLAMEAAAHAKQTGDELAKAHEAARAVLAIYHEMELEQDDEDVMMLVLH